MKRKKKTTRPTKQQQLLRSLRGRFKGKGLLKALMEEKRQSLKEETP